MTEVNVQVVQVLVSPAHRLAGRPGDGLPPAGEGELVTRAEVREGLGLVGDRYFGQRAHRDASMAQENLPVGIDPAVDLRGTRRNVLLRGVDIDSLAGPVISLDCGFGPVTFALRRPARPCAWMDVTI